MESVFAIRLEDAIDWHDVPQRLAGIADRAGYRTRARYGRWQVWATNQDLTGLISQQSKGV